MIDVRAGESLVVAERSDAACAEPIVSRRSDAHRRALPSAVHARLEEMVGWDAGGATRAWRGAPRRRRARRSPARNTARSYRKSPYALLSKRCSKKNNLKGMSEKECQTEKNTKKRTTAIAPLLQRQFTSTETLTGSKMPAIAPQQKRSLLNGKNYQSLQFDCQRSIATK